MEKEKTRTDQEITETVREFSDMLFRTALSYTANKTAAEDILQDVFLKYLTDSTLFHDSEHKKAWLLRVTINECIKYHRSVWNKRRVSLEEIRPSGIREQHDLFDLVMELPGKYRIVIHLYYYEQLSVREIGELLHLKESTVQSRLHRARKKLRKEWEVS